MFGPILSNWVKKIMYSIAQVGQRRTGIGPSLASVDNFTLTLILLLEEVREIDVVGEIFSSNFERGVQSGEVVPHLAVDRLFKASKVFELLS